MATNNKSKVFITGAGGFVGANLTRALLRKKFDVHIISRHTKIPWRLKDISEQITIHQGDITNYNSLRKILKNIQPDYIIHLAAYGAYHFQTDLSKIVNVNITGTMNLLKASIDIPYLCFINTGTSSEYGFRNGAMKETQVCKPVSYYAATKLGSTHLCKVFSELENKPIVTLRLFSVYGEYEEYTRLVPNVMYNLINKKSINLSGGTQRRDFIYIDDVCSAYLKALRQGINIKGEIVNIGTGNEYTNEELVLRTFKVSKKNTTVEIGKYLSRTWDTKHWRADITHAEKILNFKAQYTIDKGLKKTYSWFTKNRDLYRGFYEKK